MLDKRRKENYEFIRESGKYNYFRCKVCNSDIELFPQPFKQTKYSTKIGRLPVCGCYNKYRYSKEEYLILVNRKVKEISKEYEAVGILTNTKGKTTAHCFVEIYCRRHKKLISTYNINKLLGRLSSRICADCYREDVESKLMLRWKQKCLDALATGNYNHRHILRGSTRIIMDNGYKIVYSCNVCSNILDRTEFIMPAHKFCKGKTVCSCGGSYRFSSDELAGFIKRTCSTSYRFIDWLDTRGKNTFRKFSYWCTKHGFRHSRFWDWRSGNRCMLCSKTGFDDNKPADLYIIRWSDSENSYIKIGISNVFTSRLGNLKKKAKLTPQVLYRFHFKVGLDARVMEGMLKRIYNKYEVCPKELLPDGHTEAFQDEGSILEDILQTIKSIGGYSGITEH